MTSMFVPQRVEGETMEQYRERRRKAVPPPPQYLFKLSGPGQRPTLYATDALRREERDLNKNVGARQARKLLRKAKNERT